VTIGPSFSDSLAPNPWMFGPAAEAPAAANTLTAAIPAAPIAVLAVVLIVDFANFTLGSFVFLSVDWSGRPNGLGAGPRLIGIANRGQAQTWRDRENAMAGLGSNNFFNTGTICHDFGKTLT
jgi:hypothetical protein